MQYGIGIRKKMCFEFCESPKFGKFCLLQGLTGGPLGFLLPFYKFHKNCKKSIYQPKKLQETTK